MLYVSQRFSAITQRRMRWLTLIAVFTVPAVLQAQTLNPDPLIPIDNEFYSWKRAETQAAHTGTGEAPFVAVEMPKLTPKERARGFVIFQTHWSQRSFPVSVPTRDQIIKRIRLFASPGEYEPATFLVRPQRDIKEVLVTLAGDLQSDEGGRIPALNCRLGVVNGYLKYGKHPIRWAIAPMHRVSIDKDYSEQFWVTVHVPDGAAPGLYKSNLQIQVGDATAQVIRLEVEVLPISLDKPDVAFGMYFDHRRLPVQWSTIEYLEKYYRDMAEHGMTSVIFYTGNGRMEDGEIVYDFQHNNWYWPDTDHPRYQFGLDQMMDRAGRAGLLRKDIPVVYLGSGVDTQAIRERGKQLNIGPVVRTIPTVEDAQVITARAKAKGWPEIYFYLLDEWDGFDPYDGGRQMLFMREVVRPLKEAGLPTLTSTNVLHRVEDYERWFLKDKNRPLDKRELVVNEDGYLVDELLLENIYYWVDTTILQNRGGLWTPVLDKLRSLNKEYWGYDCAEIGIAPQSDRFMYGLYCWRTGTRGFYQWAYTQEIRFDGKKTWAWLDDNNVFHNTAASQYNYVVVSANGPVPTLGWEAKREGIDDYRYLLTLSRRIAQAGESHNSDTKMLAVEAQSAIDTMMASIPIEIYTDAHHKSPGPGFVNPLPKIKPKDYDDFRRTLADWIIRIDTQLGTE